MAVPATVTYSLDARIDCGSVILGYIDGGSYLGRIRIRDAAGVLLVDIPLADPGGYVNVLTGTLQLDVPAAASAAESGDAAYGEVTDSDGVVVMSLPTAESEAEQSGYLVLNALSIASGAAVSILSAYIG